MMYFKLKAVLADDSVVEEVIAAESTEAANLDVKTQYPGVKIVQLSPSTPPQE
jgi:hypothetical protein